MCINPWMKVLSPTHAASSPGTFAESLQCPAIVGNLLILERKIKKKKKVRKSQVLMGFVEGKKGRL